MKYLLSLALVCATSLHAATQITWKRQQLHGDFYSEGAGIGDINGDGKPDVVAGPFWWEGPAFEKRHAYYEPKIFSINGYSDNFFAYVHDFNGDKKNDILILGFPGKEARLYLNPGALSSDTPWNMHIVADVVDNESPVFTDITGDGKPEIVCSTGGKFGWFAPNWEKPTEKWPFVAISDDMKVAKFTHGLGVGDVNGDGKLDLLEARRWWEAPTGNREPGTGNWQQHNFAAGVGGGAQMFAYDFDGNSTQDVFTALAAHRYGVAVYLQNKQEGSAGTSARVGNNGGEAAKSEADKSVRAPNWQRIMLASENPADNDYGIVFSQPHAAHLADINGDGVQDIVVGKRYWAHNGHDPDERGARVVYWYETKRDGKGGVDFVPHLVDANSGVGVDVQVGDVNGDKLPDIVVGNKAGVFILTQQRKEISDAEARVLEPKKMYGPALKPQAEYAHGQSPQDALKAIQLPGGFKADLIAAEPDIVQPIAMCWDERGRIWVVEGMSYPQPREPGAGKDRIKILEDKDGDGTFETIKVFAEGINLASGIEVGFGGVWVGAAPYLMFIPRDGDSTVPLARYDKSNKTYASYSKVPGLSFTAYALLDGWGSQDTHETLNSFIWGPDGWLYGCHGVFTHSKVGKPGTPDDQRTPINAGVWRYHPVRHVFEVFSHGTSNPWGLDYDQNGEFFVTACVIPHLYHIVPGGRYQRQAGPHFNPYTYEDIKTVADHAHYSGSLRPDVHDATTGGGISNDTTNALGGGHAHCGLAIYQSSLFPQTYRNSLIFGNLHGHRVVSDYLDPHGSTYTGKHGSDFMRSNDMNFIPVTQKVGPDGALYISDWSDKQVCHRGSGAVELWDRSNGRIYRVSYAGWKPWKGDLSKESDDRDFASLAMSTDNEWEARMARRVIAEQAPTRPGLREQIERLALGIIGKGGSPYKEIRAYWTLCAALPKYGHDIALLDAGARTSSGLVPTLLRALQGQVFDSSDHVRFLTGLAGNQSPVVRRELASALQRISKEQRVPIARALLAHGEDKDDPYIPLLIWYGIEPVVGADAKLGLELAKASKMPKVTEFIYRRLADTPEGRVALLRVLAGMGAKPTGQLKQGGGQPVKGDSSPTQKGGAKPAKRDAGTPKGGTGAANGGGETVNGGAPIADGGGKIVNGGATIADGGGKIVNGGATIADGGGKIVNGGATIADGGGKTVNGGATIADGGGKIVNGGTPIAKVGGGGGAIPAPSASFSPEERERILGAIVAAARGSGRQVMPPDWPAIAAGLRRAAAPSALGLIEELGALFGDETSLTAFRATLADPQASPARRENALVILTQTRDAGTAALLIQLIQADDKALTRRAVQALGTLAHAETAALLVGKFGSFDAATKQDAINTLATSAAGAKVLLTAVKAKTIATTLLSPFLARQIATLKNPEVDALLKETFGDLNAPKADLAQRKQKFRPNLSPAVLAKADATKGRFVFNAVCGQCHKLFGEGQNVGPDLTGSNRANLDYVLDNVLDPNAVIGKDYQLNIFELKDGRVASGVVKEESAAAYRIALPGGIEQTITTAEVKKRTVAKVSTMPEGLFDALPTEQLQQLVAYLQTNASPAKADNPKGKPAIQVEGAIEGETLKVIEVKGGGTKLQGMAGFGGKWSNGQQLWWTGAKPGSTLTLALPVAEKGRYQLKGVLTKARDYGIVSVALDGNEVLANFDGYNFPAVVLSDELDWGTHDLIIGDHKLTFTITGTNPQAVKSYMVGLDYVKLEKK